MLALSPTSCGDDLRRRFTPDLDQPPSTLPPTAPLHAGVHGRRPTPAEQDEIGRLYERIEDDAEALNTRIRALLDGLSY